MSQATDVREPTTTELVTNAATELVLTDEDAERLSVLVLRRLWERTQRYRAAIEGGG